MKRWMGTLYALHQEGSAPKTVVRRPKTVVRRPKTVVRRAKPPAPAAPPPAPALKPPVTPTARCTKRCLAFTSELGCNDPCVLDADHEGRCMCALAVRIAKAVKTSVDDVAGILRDDDFKKSARLSARRDGQKRSSDFKKTQNAVSRLVGGS